MHGEERRLHLVKAAGRERSHPLGEPEGRAVCVFWLGAPPTIKEDGGHRRTSAFVTYQRSIKN